MTLGAIIGMLGGGAMGTTGLKGAPGTTGKPRSGQAGMIGAAAEATYPAGVLQRAKQMAEESGTEIAGYWDIGEGRPGMLLFNDPLTKSTITGNSVEDIIRKVNKLREVSQGRKGLGEAGRIGATGTVDDIAGYQGMTLADVLKMLAGDK